MMKRLCGKTFSSKKSILFDNFADFSLAHDGNDIFFSNPAGVCCRWETIILISMYGIYIIIMK